MTDDDSLEIVTVESWREGAPFGFARAPWAKEERIFVHVADCDEHRFAPGERLVCEVIETQKGLRAKRVRPAGPSR